MLPETDIDAAVRPLVALTLPVVIAPPAAMNRLLAVTEPPVLMAPACSSEEMIPLLAVSDPVA